MDKQFPTCVMLPGTLCDARVFSRQRRALKRVADVRVIDYGHWLKSGKNGVASDWLGRLLATLPQKFSVAGFSLGGIYALEMMRRAPERIEGLAMIASNARAASLMGARNSVKIKRLWQRRIQGGAEAVVQRNLPKYFHHLAARQRHSQLLRSMAQGTPGPVAFEQFSWAARRPDGLRVLSEFKGPLLIVSGDKDTLCPRAWQSDMARVQPLARWVNLPRVGHFVPLEAPAQLTHELTRWLRV
jgi:pimeloyl-ACP methyl ester carboxylesterase